MAKNAFSEHFCYQNNASFHPLFGGRSPSSLNTKRKSVLCEFFRNRIAIFSIKEHLPQTLNFRVFSANFQCARSSFGLYVQSNFSEHCVLWLVHIADEDETKL